MLDLEPLESAISAVARLRNVLKKGSNRQVRNREEKMLVKATAHAWFENQRPHLSALEGDALTSIDQSFTQILEGSDLNITRAKYIDALFGLKASLIKLRSTGVLASPSHSHRQPRFDLLIGDPKMLQILDRRWVETFACIKADAHLAATVMLGGLLEALFLARINQMKNPGPVFTARAAPRDKTGKTLPLKNWGLNDYLNIANELKWIRQSAKDVGAVLRDYRNYIHPEKELSHGITVGADDTRMFVAVFSSIADQIIASATR
jgi:hypothetical protein